jgi:bifunctional non-homologous end joining protein LigD
VSTLRFGRIVVETSNQDKVFFPADGITKGDLISYYVSVADRMLPYLKGRPLSFQRYPDGIHGFSFYQKDAPKHYPEWIETIEVSKKDGVNRHVVVDRAAGLAYLANNGVVTIHGALSRAPDILRPDVFIFDLDPSVDDFSLVRRAAKDVREVLDDLGLPAFLKTTGSRGLHLVTPIKRELGFDEVGDFARELALEVVARDPDSYTIEHRKEKRGNRLLIDWFRNRYAQTAVVPYTIRAKPGAPVATPIAWEELGKLRNGSRTFTMRTIGKRLATGVDPWATFARRARSLRPAMERLARRR